MRLQLSLLFLSFGLATSSAQVDMLFGRFTGVQQGLQLNPATPLEAKLSIGLLGGAAYYHNSVFVPGDLQSNDPLSTEISRIVDAQKEPSSINLDAIIDALSLAFRTDRGTFSLSLSQRLQLDANSNQAALRFLLEGNSSLAANRVNIQSFRSELVAFQQLSLGYTKEITEGKSFGGRLNILRGQAQGYVVNGRVLSSPLPDSPFTLEAEGLLRSSGLVRQGVDSISPQSVLTAGGNPGVSIDLGFHESVGNGWTVSASLLDIGFIRWNRFTQDYGLSGGLVSDGLQGAIGRTDDDQLVLDSLFSQLDRIKDVGFLEVVDYNNPYTRFLWPRMSIGAEVELTKIHHVGGGYVVRFHGSGVDQSANLSYRAKIGSWLQAGLSYGLTDGVYHQLGAGLVVQVGPVQLYGSSDNLYQLVNHDKLAATTARAGLNLVFPVEKASSRKGGKGKVDCYKF